MTGRGVFEVVVGEYPEAGVALPPPRLEGTTSIEAALARRRSIREFAPTPLRLADLGQLLWAAQGITAPLGGRTAPSAGAIHPLEIYVAAAEVDGLPAGMYRYLPAGHALEPLSDGDPRPGVAAAAFEQESILACAAAILFAAAPDRTTGRYGDRGPRYIHMETGHAAQNVLLQAAGLGVGGVVLGAFNDERMAKETNLRPGEEPLYLVGLGNIPT